MAKTWKLRKEYGLRIHMPTVQSQQVQELELTVPVIIGKINPGGIFLHDKEY